MLDVSALKLKEMRLSIDIDEFNLKVVSFRRSAYITGGMENPQSCLRLDYNMNKRNNVMIAT